MLFLEIVLCIDHLAFMVKYVSYYSKVLFKLFPRWNCLLWDTGSNANSKQWSVLVGVSSNGLKLLN